MVSIATTSIGMRRSQNDGVGAPGQISMLLKQIDTLHKKISQLQKQLQDMKNPEDRMIIIKEIIDLERQVQLLQQQIAQIEQNESLKAKRRAEARAELTTQDAQKKSTRS